VTVAAHASPGQSIATGAVLFRPRRVITDPTTDRQRHAHRADREPAQLSEQGCEDAAEAERHDGQGEELEAVGRAAVAQPQRRTEADGGDDEARCPQGAAAAPGRGCGRGRSGR